MIPVSDTPSRRSSSVLFCHTLRKYGNFVNLDCIVPKMVASSTFLDKLLISSVARTTISVRLQNWYGRNIISEQGLQANSQSASRLPFLAACFCAACLLKIPRSPD